MKIPVSDRMTNFKEGIFQILNEKKIELEDKGVKVYNFSIGTPDFQPSKSVMDAVSNAALNPDNYKYSMNDLQELISALIKRYQKRYQVNLTRDEIMSVYGSQEGTAHLFFSLINPGDIVLVPDPGYPIFKIGPSLAGADVRTYELLKDNSYLPNLTEIEKNYGKNSETPAKVMIVSYPLNPICKCAPKSFYEQLIQWAKENNILLVHDNAYSDIIYDGRNGISILSIPDAKKVSVEFYSLSKSFNYTGARMGFLVGNKTVVQNFKRLRSQIDYGTFFPVQYGAIEALNEDDDKIKMQCKEYQNRRDALCDGLNRIGWPVEYSEGSMFIWAKIPKGFKDDIDFVMQLLNTSGVLCTPGSSFGKLGKNHVRFALTLPEHEILEAIEKVEQSKIIE